MDTRVTHFKIGKTVDPVKDRYDHDEDYINNYDGINLIYETENKQLVDDLEKILIRDYMMMYPTKCDNRQEGAGPNCADSDKPTAKIYVVVKYKG